MPAEIRPIDLGRLTDEATSKLDTLPSNNPVGSHHEADAILCELLRSLGLDGVADAFGRARERCEFWYS